MNRHDLSHTVAWMRAGTTHLLTVVDSLDDEELSSPSALPGWTRAHVIGHLARNAEALHRLATWAATGVQTPMYADSDQRASEIEKSAGLPASTLRQDLASTAQMLDEGLAALTPQQWRTEVRSALGRTIPAAELPWMRVREVWLHAADLHIDASTSDLPGGVVDLLLDDVTAALSTKEGCPSLHLAPTDRDRTWRLGRPRPTATIRGSAADLTGWLTGRDTAHDRPALPRWL